MPVKSALLIIDMQTALVTGAYDEAKVLRAINSVIHNARRAGSPIIFIQHNHQNFEPLRKGNEGWKIHPALAPEPGDLLIEKEASDAFYRTKLEEELRRLDITTVVVCGMQTEYCVDATCRAALSRDFDVELISDGHTTGPSHLSAPEIIDHHNTVLANLAHPHTSIRVVPAADANFRIP